jgi:hypothetical protein
LAGELHRNQRHWKIFAIGTPLAESTGALAAGNVLAEQLVANFSVTNIGGYAKQDHFVPLSPRWQV